MEKNLNTLVDMFNQLSDRQKKEVLDRMETSILKNLVFGIPCDEPGKIIIDVITEDMIRVLMTQD